MSTHTHEEDYCHEAMIEEDRIFMRDVCRECKSYVPEQGHGLECSKWEPTYHVGDGFYLGVDEE